MFDEVKDRKVVLIVTVRVKMLKLILYFLSPLLIRELFPPHLTQEALDVANLKQFF